MCPTAIGAEVPATFVTVRPGVTVKEDELIERGKARISRSKAPKRIYFGEPPKTAAGKIQKSRLRALAQEKATES